MQHGNELMLSLDSDAIKFIRIIKMLIRRIAGVLLETPEVPPPAAPQ